MGGRRAHGQAELERWLLGAAAQQRRVVEPDFACVHVKLRRKGVTLTLLWEEYRAAHHGERSGLHPVLRALQVLRQDAQALHAPVAPRWQEAVRGLCWPDPAALGASSCTFVCVTADQSMG